MPKNLYYRSVYQRRNVIKDVLYMFFLGISSYPRLLLEVFIRKDFGERYFKLSSVVTIVVIFGALPFILNGIINSGYGSRSRDFMDILNEWLSWYIFLLAFILISIKHSRDLSRSLSSFDFGRFSMSSGISAPWLYKIKLFGKEPNERQIECLIEPLLFFLIGLVFLFLGIKVGLLIFVSSILYCLSYVAAYAQGDDFVLDKIDEMISTKNLHSSFVEGIDASQTDGYKARGRKPKDRDAREKMAEEFIVPDDDDYNLAD